MLRILGKGSAQNSQNQLGADEVVSGVPFSKLRHRLFSGYKYTCVASSTYTPEFDSFKHSDSLRKHFEHSTFNIQHSAFYILHSTFNIQHSTLEIQHSAFKHSGLTQHFALKHSTHHRIVKLHSCNNFSISISSQFLRKRF